MTRSAAFCVGIVGPLPPPPGGMANQTRQLAELLRQSGLSVEIVRTNGPYRPSWIARLWAVRALFRLVPYAIALWRCAGRADVFHVMANSGWAWHLFAAPAVWIARLRGTPVVLNYRGGLAEAFLARRERVIRLTLDRVARVIVPSDYLREVFARREIECTVVPNVVDLARFSDEETSAPGAALVITRNLEEIYGIDIGIRAFAKVHRVKREARLTIAGDGPERPNLERLCRDLGVSEAVTFTGPLDRADMARLYRSANVVLNPARVDNTPNSLLEALAAGVPVVSTDAGGIPYIIEHGRTGLLACVDDADGLAEHAIRVLHEPELAGRLRRAGLEEATKYAWPAVKEQLIDVYRTAIDRAAPDTARV